MPEEAEARVEITIHDLDLKDIIGLGQGHLHLDGIIHDQDLLKHLGGSLPISVMDHKGKENVDILIDSEKFHHLMIEKLTVEEALTLEIHLKKNLTEIGRENAASGMKNCKGYPAGAQAGPSANRGNFSPERFSPLHLQARHML